VVITGSTSGIGLGLAEAFAAAGCHLQLNGFGLPAQISHLVQGIEQRFRVRVSYSPADLAYADQCTALINDAITTFGQIDILINNAGIQHVAPVEAFPPEKWDAILAVNLSAPFHTIRAVLPGMQRRGYGRIVNIASVHGLVASTNKAAYVASKHGLLGLTKTVALENAGRGITCNAICPGFVRTELIARQIEERALEKGISEAEAEQDLLREKQPSGEFTRIGDIAALAMFLCSQEAANMTGACLPIDGGWTSQ